MAHTLRPTPANPQRAVSAAPSEGALQRLSAVVLIGAPLAGLVWATAWAWDDGVSRVALAIAVGMYLVTGHGLSVGFHRMLTHRSFRPNRALKIALAIAGSMAAEGSVFTWVAQHRRHLVTRPQPNEANGRARRPATGSRLTKAPRQAPHIAWPLQ